MRKAWKQALSGMLVIAMTLSPIGNIRTVLAEETAATATETVATTTETKEGETEEATTETTTTEGNTAEVTTTEEGTTEAATEAATEDSGDDTTDTFGYDDPGVILILPEETDAEETVTEEESADEEMIPEELEADRLGDIPLTAKYFPDQNFRKQVAALDKDQNGVLSSKERAVKELSVGNSKIKDVTGIRYFTELEDFNCEVNQITKLDLSKNTKLKTVSCINNNISDLNLSGCAELTGLDCSMNSIKKLDVSKNSKLMRLQCHTIKITGLDVSHNPALQFMDCSHNKITKLDVRHNPELQELYCGSTQITDLDLSHNPALTVFLCRLGNLKTLNISKSPALKTLDCIDNQLKILDVSHNPALEYLDCNDNQLKTLDVSKNPALKYLNCSVNKLKKLDVSRNPALQTLSCAGMQLKRLDVSHNPELSNLYCSRNKLTQLDVSKNKKLFGLYCESNRIQKLDVSKNTELVWLWCDLNRIQKLDLTHNPELISLNCGGNQLACLDVSKNKKMLSYTNLANSYSVRLNSKRQFDLTTLPGFQASKVSNLHGGTISGNTLTFSRSTMIVYYTYDCGNGHSSVFELVEDISGPTTAFCERLYTLCLGREADESGVRFWALRLMGGSMTGADVGYGVVFSQEYKKKNTSNEEYVKMLYQVFMNRQADKGGLNYWVGLLNDGMSREYVYKGFAESTEFTNICNSYGINRGTVTIRQARDRNVNLTRFVNRIYVKAMNRKGEEAGLNYWCEQIQYKRMTPTQVAESFIYSKEFTDKKLSNTEYVKVLYRTFMGREADQSGLNYWVDRLNRGESRKTILKSFAGCPEFKNIVKSFGL